MSGQGSFSHQRTPVSCIESALRIGTDVSISGQVILPLRGAVRSGDTQTHVVAREIGVLGASAWAGPSGRSLRLSLLATSIGLVTCVGCLLWAEIL